MTGMGGTTGKLKEHPATLATALVEVDRLERALSEWTVEESLKGSELEEFEAASALRLVDDPGKAEELTEQATRLRTGLALIKRTVAAADEQLVSARRAALHAYATELRAQAKALHAEATDRQKRTDVLLAELRAWEGCAFEPRMDWTGAGSSGVRDRTRTDLMKHQATHLETQAATVEGQAAGLPADQLAHQVRCLAAKQAAQSVAEQVQAA